jgi:predicted Zn-dependent protease
MALAVATLTGCGGGHLISQSQEIDMGKKAGDQFERENGGRDADPAINALVQTVATRITAAAKPPDYPYDVRVLASKQINAVAFPGGRIYLFRGLIDNFDRNPDQLAWVLAHETTHVAHRHAVKQTEQQLGYEAIIALIFNKGDAPQIAGAVANLALLGYGRDEELEADQYGLVFAHAAGYDPTASIGVLQGFQKIQGKQPNNFEIMLSTHPGDNTRIDHVKSYLQTQGWRGQYFTPTGGG